MMHWVKIGLAMAVCMATPLVAQDNPNQPPAHDEPFPNLGIGKDRRTAQKSFERAPHLERDQSAKVMLEQQRRLDRAFAELQPQRAGTIDAYVVTVAFDSDPVFAREAREAGRVLARRYGGEGRTLTLAGPDGERDDLPKGSIRSFLMGLARVAEIMDPDEDVLVLYTTSHGAKVGLINHYGNSEYGILSPAKMKETLEELGIKRRLLIISACYSGVFVPQLASEDSVVLTAAAAQRTSFGCEPDNEWTFYGDALINRELRKPQSLAEATKAATRTVAEWELRRRLLSSLPQTSIGSKASIWLDDLEARMPKTATKPVGKSSGGE